MNGRPRIIQHGTPRNSRQSLPLIRLDRASSTLEGGPIQAQLKLSNLITCNTLTQLTNTVRDSESPDSNVEGRVGSGIGLVIIEPRHPLDSKGLSEWSMGGGRIQAKCDGKPAVPDCNNRTLDVTSTRGRSLPFRWTISASNPGVTPGLRCEVSSLHVWISLRVPLSQPCRWCRRTAESCAEVASGEVSQP